MHLRIAQTATKGEEPIEAAIVESTLFCVAVGRSGACGG